MDGQGEARNAAKVLSSEEWERLRAELERSLRETEETLKRTETLLLAAALLRVPYAVPSRSRWSVVEAELAPEQREIERVERDARRAAS